MVNNHSTQDFSNNIWSWDLDATPFLHANTSFAPSVTMEMFKGENSNLSLSVPARRWTLLTRQIPTHEQAWHCDSCPPPTQCLPWPLGSAYSHWIFVFTLTPACDWVICMPGLGCSWWGDFRATSQPPLGICSVTMALLPCMDLASKTETLDNILIAKCNAKL